jgi:hypothetical protein
MRVSKRVCPTKTVSPLLLFAALASTLVLQACSTASQPATPKPGPIIRPGLPAPGPALPPITETRKGRSVPVEIAPIPSAEKADIQIGDRLWLRGGEGSARPSTILREVVNVQAGQAQYRQFELDSSGRPGPQARSRRQNLSSLELDNPAKASGQVRYTDFPLGLGKTWSYRYQLKGKNGSLTSYDIVARVEAEETVNTPAGSFKTLKILHGGQWNVPVVEAGVVKVSSGSLRSTLWFAPAIGNWVRFESEILNSEGGPEARVYQELIKFERRVSP